MLGHIWWTFQTLFWDWRLTRPRDHLLLKILMVLLIPSGVTLLALSYQMDRRRVRVNYLLAAREAIRNEKLEQAELYFRKAAYLNPNVDEAALDYWHAILAERQNDLDRARRLMFRLLIRRGTPQTIQVGAHIWMCEDVLRMEKLSQKEFEQLAQHLRIILGLVERLPKQGEPLTATTRGLGMISEAISHVCLRLPRMFQMNLQTARYFAANGDVTFAKQLIESSIGILQRFAKEEPASVEYNILLANNLSFAERFPEAEQILLACHKSTRDSRIEKALIHTYLEAAQTVQARTDGPTPDVVRIIQRAYALAKDDPDILDRMATFLGAGIGFDAKTSETLDVHIHKRVDEKPHDMERRFTLANLYLAQQKLEPAARELAKVAEERPAVRLILARVLKRLNRSAEANEQIQLASNVFVPRLKEDKSRASDRLLIADLLSETGRWEQAIELIKLGLDETDVPQLRSGLAYQYYRWADQTKDLDTRLDRLLTGLDVLPDHAGIQTRLFSLANEPGNTGDKTLARLKERLLQGKDAPFVHLALGTAAAAKKDFATAQTHLQVALVAMPDNTLLLNNLAHVLVNTVPPEARRALSHIDRAKQINPNAAEIRETRGEVLMTLERWEEAVSELEFALRFLPDQAKLHELLATAYAKLGNRELSEQHAKAAQK